jgi:hypothetical protein
MSNEQFVSSPMGSENEEAAEVQETEEDFTIDVLDDTPEEDRNRKAPAQGSPDHDEELKSVSNSVQKRIKKLKFDYHEERRNKENAARMRDEAVTYAKKIADENKQLRDLLNKGEQVLIDEVKSRTENDVLSAKEKLKRAHEEGDTDALADAQEQLARAAYDARKAAEFQPISPTPEQQPEPQPQAAPQQAAPDPKATQWANRNPWFQTDREMTAFVFAVHEGLIKQGVNPSSDQYYSLIDQKMQERFPEKFEGLSGESQVSQESSLRPDGAPRKPSAVVAPARRASGAKGRKIQMTKTQVALAKRLGITPEQYAKQVLELEKANG